MQNSFYGAAWYFLLYAVLGWCAEVAYAAVKTKGFVNRGFLNGPYCPIYGFGMLIVIYALTPMKGNLLLLFAGSFLLTSLLELVTGYVLEKFFDDKWWDYSREPLNIHGYVCLRFSILWGVACVVIMRGLQPLMENLVRHIPHRVGIVLLVVFFLLFLADAAMTVSALLHLKKQLRLVKEINEKLRALSNTMGKSIYSGTIAALDKSAHIREELEDSEKAAVAEFEEYKNRWQEYLTKPRFGTRRLLKAFPDFGSGRPKEHLNILSELWNKNRRK